MKCDCSSTLCPEHRQSFLDILADVPGRLNTMNVSIMKQAVMGGQGGKPTNDDDRPLPVNLGAAEAQKALMVALAEVCRRVRHCLPEGTLPTYAAIPAWLTNLMPRIVAHPESVDWYHRIRNEYEKAGKAIDLPPERIRAGKCTECHAVLYTVEGHEKVRCRPCNITYPVWELQTLELSHVMNYVAGAAMIIKVLERAEIKLKFKTLTSWADRGQVTYTETADGRIFRVGDVLKTIETMRT